MELWKTNNNNIQTVNHPPGYQNYRFFRPVMATYDARSIILAGSKIIDNSDDGEDFLSEMFRYKINRGWINLGAITPPLESKEQFGIYMLNNPGLAVFDSLNSCS